jgi:hypothetical protein
LEILKWECGSVQTSDLEKNYEDVPSNKSLVLYAARDYAAHGYAEIFDKDNRKINPKESLDFSKEYILRLTPAGEVLAAALPPLFVAGASARASIFWMGTGAVLELLPQIIEPNGEIVLSLPGYGESEIFFAFQQYERAGLVTPMNTDGISKITNEGLRFGAAIRKAEEMVEKQRHPLRNLWERKRPRKIPQGDILVPQG